MQYFEKPSRTFILKKPRPNDTHLSEIINNTLPFASLHKAPPGFVLVGHADDEGVRLNQGRVGCNQGPDAIRTMFYRLTPGQKKFPQIYDLGNFAVKGKFAERQKIELMCTQQIYKNKNKLISLGGGHDHAYVDVAGFLKCLGKKRALVINIDAHLDMRTVVDSPNSGTAFYQLREEFNNFDLVQIGIQPQTNSFYHLDYAKKRKVKVYTLIESLGKLEKIFKSLTTAVRATRAQKKQVFLSIDLDAFSAAYAPGVSAPSPIGLDPHELVLAMPLITELFDIRGIGLYEVAPPLDYDNHTAKLAASILHSFLYHSPDL